MVREWHVGREIIAEIRKTLILELVNRNTSGADIYGSGNKRRESRMKN